MHKSICALGMLAATAGLLPAADVTTPAAACFANPAQEIEFFNINQLRGTRRLVVPTLYLRVMTWSRTKDGTTDAGTIREIEATFEPEALRALAASLYDDLAGRLRAAGWEVITPEALASNPRFGQLPLREPDKNLGAPVDEEQTDAGLWRHLVVTPPGMPAIRAGATGPIWAMRDVLRELTAGALIPTYTFDVVAAPAAGPAPEPVEGAASTASTTLPRPQLQLTQATLEFYTVQLSSGWMRTRAATSLPDIIPGTFTEHSGRGSGAFSRALGSLSTIATGRKETLALAPDLPAFEGATLTTVQAFNAACVQTVRPYAPQP